MIAYIKGELASIEENSVVIDKDGMGMRVHTPIREELLRKGIGSIIQLHTYMAVREDAITLYGFLDPNALTLFKQLINVNSVGPKMALAILTAMNADQLMLAIAAGDKAALTKVSGVGGKTADRILLDLKDKVQLSTVPTEGASVGVGALSDLAAPSSAASEAIMALVALGYSQSEAAAAVQKTAQEGMNTQEIIRQSLKQL